MLEDYQQRQRMGGKIMPSVQQRPQSLLDIARQGTSNFMRYKPNTGSPSMGDIAKFGINVAPFVGDAVAIEDAKREYEKGNIGTAAFNALTALPLIGDVAAAAKVSIPAMASLGGLAGMMWRGGKSLPTPTGSIGRQRGIIGGINAKTADLDALNVAQDLTNKGIPREQIWADTGWFKGADDKWRFEIDDSQAALKDWTPQHGQANMSWPERKGAATGLGLDDYIEHDKMSSAYFPLREDSPSVFFHEGDGGASYVGKQDSIYLDPRLTLDPEAQKSVSLHEIQHAIQGREGFARGGSPEMFKGLSVAEVDKFNQEWGDVSFLKKQGAEKFEWLYDRKPTAGEIYLAENTTEETIRKNMAELTEQARPNWAHKQYESLAGEAEARAVQTRMNLTPDERAARPFWED